MPRKLPRLWKDVLVSGVAVASLGLSSCGHSGVVLVGPDECEALTDRQLLQLEAMIATGDYPAVVEIVSAYDQHCREDDALMERGE